MKNVKLPEMITRAYYNCFEQQIMMLCYHFCGEFWKLFMGQHLEFDEREIVFVEDTLKYRNSILRNAEMYYGIHLEKEECMYDLRFGNNEIYLAHIDTKYYSDTQDIEEDGIHCILLYGMKDGDYIANDNYYGYTDLMIEKNIYQQGVKSIYSVHHVKNKKIGEDFNEFVKSFSYSSYQEINKSYQYIINNKIVSYQSADLMDIINKISSFIKKDALMAGIWSNNDIHVKQCASMLGQLADKAKKNFFVILKLHLKYGMVPCELLYERIENIVKIIKNAELIKQEILNILLQKENIKDDLYRQVKKYLEKDEFDDNKSVYEMHDKLSIIYLINFFENNNQITDLDYDDFRNCESYLDFELVVYEKIFLDGV